MPVLVRVFISSGVVSSAANRFRLRTASGASLCPRPLALGPFPLALGPFPLALKKPPGWAVFVEWICKPSSVIEGSHLSRPAVAGRLKPPVGYAPSERALLHPVGVAPGRVYMAAQSPVRR